MSSNIAFTHILNPFPAKEGSEHAIASSVTWRTLRVAKEIAVEQGIEVEYHAVILPGDEPAIDKLVTKTAYLERSVQDLVLLRPVRPLPLIQDILTTGARGARTSHVIFSNMDIAVLPQFYVRLREIITNQLGLNVPFTVARVNIDSRLASSSLESMYVADGPTGEGYDCFILPCALVDRFDLGACCIGAPFFDILAVMECDVISATGVKTLRNERLTFHLGSDIAWAAMIDYVEHNLSESLSAIERMRKRYDIADGSLFDRSDKRLFRPHTQLSSKLARKIKRLPGVSSAVLRAKRALGRQF